MATKITCDLCGKEITKPVKLRMRNGTSYHNGDIEYRRVDCCVDCLISMSDLRTSSEYYDCMNELQREKEGNK